MLSGMATCKSHGEESSYFLGWQLYDANPFHPQNNPSGIIQMGLAENQLSVDLLESWIKRNEGTLWFNEDGGSIFRDLAIYQDYHGLPQFKKVLAEYLSDIRQNKVTFDCNKLVLTAGATAANETLIFCLAGPGDAFLIPTPYYPGFDRDLKWRTGVELIPIHCSSSNNFRITKSTLQQAHHLALQRHLTVKGIFITNPSNPLGTSLTPHELNILISFSISTHTHIVCDEIFSGTVFAPPAFLTLYEALSRRVPDQDSPVWRRVHLVSSLSKDLGLSGFRIGLVYSNNHTLLETATKMSSFSLVSSQSQFLLSRILADKKFIRDYTVENRRRLRIRHDVLVRGLEESGIRCLETNAGLFCWVDMRCVLRAETFEAEMEVWKEMVIGFGLNVSPGSSCHCMEPGWFRVCFANMEESTLHLAVQRIRALVHSKRLATN